MQDHTGEVDSYNFSGWIIGGRNNNYGCCQCQRRRSQTKPSTPGAVPYGYSFTPYPRQFPPPPPLGYAGDPPPQIACAGHGYYGGPPKVVGSSHGYYGGSQMAFGAHGYIGGRYQLPPPNQGCYNCGTELHNYN